MSAPTPVVRAVTYERDGERCVSCGSRVHLEFQHRRATGMGGSKRPPGFTDGLTTCASCNPAYEGVWQLRALLFGWKVRRWIPEPGRVPVWYAIEREWFVLDQIGRRSRVAEAKAHALMREAYGPAWDQWRAAA